MMVDLNRLNRCVKDRPHLWKNCEKTAVPVKSPQTLPTHMLAAL
jgi:hypothetical protein